MRARLRASALAGLLALAAVAAAAGPTLYRWVDAQGRVQYSDKPPKNFAGTVTPIVTDTETTSVPAPPRPQPPAAPEAEPKEALKAPLDIATERRQRRQRLEAKLGAAEAKLAAARAALAAAGSAEPDERQVIQQVVKGDGSAAAARAIPNADPTQGSMVGGGMHGMASRSNCRQATNKDGKLATICPTVLPGSGYYERIAQLEKAVRDAEEELEEAERLYRRGRD